MKFADLTKPDRKSGVAEWRDLRFFPILVEPGAPGSRQRTWDRLGGLPMLSAEVATKPTGFVNL
jgi:hypothetical protein